MFGAPPVATPTPRSNIAWLLSQFLHGEQGALVCTGLITVTVPWIDAKYYAATQVTRGDTVSGDDVPIARPWATTEPGRLVGRGHPAGDFLEASAWDVIEEDDRYVRVSAHLPDHVLNPRGQLFGGFTPTYVDLIALFTVNSRARPGLAVRASLARTTTSMRVDCFEPVVGPQFIIDSRREKQRGRTHVVLTRFLQDGELAVLAATTIREISRGRSLGDL